MVAKEQDPTKGARRMRIPLLFIAIYWLILEKSAAFSVTFGRDIHRREETLRLAAKAVKKKGKSKSKTSNSGGGFGKSAAAEVVAEVADDYAVFPALEQPVEDSLVPSPPELQEVGALPVEVYDRLDKIYGFPHFNYQNDANESRGDDDVGVSFNELISAPASPPPSLSTEDTESAPTSIMTDLDIANLLASATGDDTIPSSGVDNNNDDNNIEDISNLPQFSKFRVLHVDPLVLAIDDFFTDDECERYIDMSENPIQTDSDDSSAAYQTRSKTVGKDLRSKAQRTSTTWFHHYKNVPELIAKASRLLGLESIYQWEEAQTVRYRRNEKFTWHLDALAPGGESSPSQGGQRTATLLVYLTDLAASDGGATIFRDLSSTPSEQDSNRDVGSNDNNNMLKVQPKKGSALLFFPAAGGIPNTPFDIRTLHCGEAVDASSSQDKWISQLWLRESAYTPSAPPGNLHELARNAISDYCSNS